MAEERAFVSIPKSTDKIVTELAKRMDETKGKVIKKAIEVFAKKVNK